MMEQQEHIFLLVQSGYSARNFILSGFLNQDKAKVTFWSDQDYIDQYSIENELVKLPDFGYNAKINFIQKIKNKAELFFNVKTFKNQNYKSYLIGINNSTSIRIQLKNWLSSRIASFYANEKGIEKLDKPFYKEIRKTNYYALCKAQLEKHKPTTVFCTHQRASSAVAPMLAAKDLGIKTVCFVHSWDNIPKGVQLVKADTYFVWSEYMKNEMLSHYPFIDGNKIQITGTPQFVPYYNQEFRLERDVFLSSFDLDTNKKYILFSGNDKTTSPNDPIYLEDVCKAVIQLNKEEDIYRIVFRPNPIDRNEGFDAILNAYSKIVTELKPDWFGANDFRWNKGGPSKKDLTLLVNTILHSEMIVNMGSTMALDAALLGKASCYINYDVPSNYNWTVKRTYNFIHFNMIKSINPVFWIHKREDVSEILQKALLNPSDTEKGREKWIHAITKLPIEETNKRMWNHLISSDEI